MSPHRKGQPPKRYSGWLLGILCLFPWLRMASLAHADSPATTFEVTGYHVDGNSVLPRAEVDEALRSGLGPKMDLPAVRKALAELQSAYRRRGYVTVAVTLPPQQISNGVVQVRVTEAPLAAILVTGNRWYSTENVRRALPGLTTNTLLNMGWFQPELDRANENRDRQIYPSIIPGPEPGTSALQLKVKDRLPLHGHVEVNDRSTPATPLLRIDTALQYNNLWQRDHQFGVQANFSPQETKVDDYLSRKFYDDPKVDNYSAFYRIPLWNSWGLEEPAKKPSSTFGYDPVLRTFVLPPTTGAPELIVYASHSSSETQTRVGPQTIITNSALLDLFNQSSEREFTVNENLGTKLFVPLPTWRGIRSTVTFGVDYKYYNGWTYSTNVYTVNIYSTNSGDRVLVSSQSVPHSSVQSVSLDYIPLSVGWSGQRPDAYGNTSLNYSQSLFLEQLASPESRFQQVAGSTQAGGTYTTLQLALTRDQKLGGRWNLLLRASGQWASAPVIGNEQFVLGGLSGVRGYHDGEDYGDAGWKVLLDLRPPAWRQADLEGPSGPIATNFRFSGFLDYGERYLLDAPSGRRSTQRMLGVGAGWLINVGEGFEARVVVGIPLLDGPLSSTGSVRAYFNVGYQF